MTSWQRKVAAEKNSFTPPMQRALTIGIRNLNRTGLRVLPFAPGRWRACNNVFSVEKLVLYYFY